MDTGMTLTRNSMVNATLSQVISVMRIEGEVRLDARLTFMTKVFGLLS